MEISPPALPEGRFHAVDKAERLCRQRGQQPAARTRLPLAHWQAERTVLRGTRPHKTRMGMIIRLARRKTLRGSVVGASSERSGKKFVYSLKFHPALTEGRFASTGEEGKATEHPGAREMCGVPSFACSALRGKTPPSPAQAPTTPPLAGGP